MSGLDRPCATSWATRSSVGVNAGIANLGTVAVGDTDALVRTIDVNLTEVVRTVAAALPYVSTRRGYFLLVSSVAAFTALLGGYLVLRSRDA